MSAKFPCTACGACCLSLDLVPNFPEPVLPNGVCSHYDPASRQCRIYERRPLICRVDETFDAGLSKASCREAWHAQIMDRCEMWIQLAGMDEGEWSPRRGWRKR